MSADSSKNIKPTARGEALPSAIGPKCGATDSGSNRHCPTCGLDLGCPNVRAATLLSEISALSERFTIARDNATKRGLTEQFDALVAAINSETHVVVAMPLLYARSFLADPRMLYAGYENLVGGKIRTPASFKNDSDRFAVSGKLFASYGGEISYGVLSLNGVGLRNYGVAFLMLRDVAIEQRVSFLHENSFLFLAKQNLSVLGIIPRGYRSCWHNRSNLVAAKLESVLTADAKPVDWAGQLVVQGATRAEDSCIEAHIFGCFNADSIQSVEFANSGTSRSDKIDIKVIKELMSKRTPERGAP